MSKFEPNFSHRLAAMHKPEELFSTSNMTDTVLLMVEQSVAIIDMVSAQFSCETDKPFENMCLSALSAASNSVKDIRSIIEAWDAQQPKTKKAT